jgi:hypothetical protein
VNPSGGLLWHWRAWRSQDLWRPTCEQIENWLAQVQPKSSELILIGASAGWMMSSRWLQNFKRVMVWDIDGLAAPLFRWRHAAALGASGTQLVFNRSDALNGLDSVLRAHPKACVLFDNVLGQYRFHFTEQDQVGQKIAQLIRTLKGREWGSLHDAYSGPVNEALNFKNLPGRQERLQGESGAERADQAWFLKLGAQGEWLDHLTDSVFEKGTLVHHIAWPYSPRYCHWLQAGWIHP